MSTYHPGTSKKHEEHEEETFKGTMASVGILAAVIVVMWVAVFWIYMSRV